MSTNRMIIDAAHPEETRVAVLSGNRLQDFDVESVARKQIKGNIYLAKVIRVEPSLQAAFVDYGGNRHGFLSFSEIHPDYYQIPIEDRQALLAAHEAAAIEEDASEEPAPEAASDEASEDPEVSEQPDEEASSEPSDNDDGANAGEGEDDDDEEEVGAPKSSRKGVETLGGDDSEDARPKRRVHNHRHYKIQEVIKRRQILLIQVVKEERGNKGAALTTYISLAGRYCVLMPNTARGGGISRKITNGADRKHLKNILTGLKIPEGMAVIVRTAGIKRTKAEIKRDYEYLVRLWDSVRDLTLESSAPTLVHEEGNLIKRSIRDLYTGDISEIIVAGDAGYRLAKDFIKLLIPSHAKRVQPYSGSTEPIFQHYQVESQLDAIHSPEVQLKSGAYIVINPTEALVSIDVNSGRSTRERNIEETAYKTNLEAADEIARQLRLRDLAGLIVVDFIDMEVSRNNAQVERRMKDAMRSDRARIQIGRISPFGLLEMSRQRLRMSLIETSSEPCPYCGGTGIRRSTDSAALVALRTVQEEANRQRATQLIVHVPTAVALYILNQKRSAVAAIEESSGISVIITADESLIPPDLRIERVGASGRIETVSTPASSSPSDSRSDEKPGKRRRRPRRRKHSDGENTGQGAQESAENQKAAEAQGSTGDGADSSEAPSTHIDGEDGKAAPKRRRRGKRGGRRRRGRSDEKAVSESASEVSLDETAETQVATPQETAPTEDTPKDAAPTEDAAKEQKETVKKPARRRSRAKKADSKTEATESGADSDKTQKTAEATVESPVSEDVVKAEKEEKPKRPRRPRKKAVVEEKPDKKAAEPIIDPGLIAAAAKTTVINVGDSEPVAKEKPKRGWWRR